MFYGENSTYLFFIFHRSYEKCLGRPSDFSSVGNGRREEQADVECSYHCDIDWPVIVGMFWSPTQAKRLDVAWVLMVSWSVDDCA